MAVPEIMCSSFCWRSAVRSFLNLLTRVIAQIIEPYNIYIIKFVKHSFRAIKVDNLQRKVCEAEHENQEKKSHRKVCCKSEME